MREKRPLEQSNRKVAVIQAGGPTAVMNCSLLGFLSEMRRLDPAAKMLGVRHGIGGLVEGSMAALDPHVSREWLRYTPGAALGAGRKALSDDDLELCVQQLRKADVHELALIGGNGTMWTCRSLARKAKELSYELRIIGIPKTVDNDIMNTDHTPGFASAARFVSHAVRDLAVDLASMKNFEQVRVIETMGRNAGWLTAAAAFFKRREQDAPHLVYVPETPFYLERMLQDVAEVHKGIGYCVVVVGEGLKDQAGQPLMMEGIKGNGRHQALGGIGSYVADTINGELGLACRYENLGILQRCSSLTVSKQDQAEAEAVGIHAARLICAGSDGVMAAIKRTADDPYEWQLDQVPFELVAGVERLLDASYIKVPGQIDASFHKWLSPLLADTMPFLHDAV